MDFLVNIIGLGYIGLPTSLMLASNGVKVVGTDVDADKIAKLKEGKLTFDEAGLDNLFKKAVENNIEFCEDCIPADIYIVALPTPYNKRTRRINPDYVISGVKSVLEKCRENSVIVVESTVSPGTIDQFLQPLVSARNSNGKMSVSLAHAPERIIPGNMVNELINNNRIIGAYDRKIAEKIKELYSTFCKGNIVVTDIKTAELAKVAENTYRDINIAYANELLKICREADVDVYELINIANMHPRVNILSPGPGVGGHCISVDPWFLVGDYPEIANLILISRRVNDSMPEYVLERISGIMEEKGIRSISDVGLYGLTYKENVDDMRESPTLQLISCMKRHASFGIKVYDPYIKEDVTENQYHDLNRFMSDIKMVVIMVGHDEIKEYRNWPDGICILDTRNVLNIKGKYHL